MNRGARNITFLLPFPVCIFFPMKLAPSYCSTLHHGRLGDMWKLCVPRAICYYPQSTINSMRFVSSGLPLYFSCCLYCLFVPLALVDFLFLVMSRHHSFSLLHCAVLFFLILSLHAPYLMLSLIILSLFRPLDATWRDALS